MTAFVTDSHVQGVFPPASPANPATAAGGDAAPSRAACPAGLEDKNSKHSHFQSRLLTNQHHKSDHSFWPHVNSSADWSQLPRSSSFCNV